MTSAWTFVLLLAASAGAEVPPDLVLVGPDDGTLFGAFLGTAGDVDGDGFDDVYVGAYDSTALGAAYVYPGGPAGLDPVRVITLEGSADADYLGRSAVGADLDADGFSDLALDAGSTVRVHPGGAGGLAVEARGGVEPGDDADVSLIVSGGDLDGDSIADMVAFTPLADDEDVLVPFLGVPGDLPAPGAPLGGPERASLLSLPAATDLDGDGLADVVALWSETPGQTLLVYAGADGGPDATPTWSYRREDDDEASLLAAITGGDVDGDGHPDLVLRTSDYSGSELHVYPGGAALTEVPTWTVPRPSLASAQWLAVAIVGDTDGDGFDDLFATAYDADIWKGVLVRLPGGPGGPSEPLDSTYVSRTPDVGFIDNVAAAGDVNGDCLADTVATLAPPDESDVPSDVWLFLGEGPAACPVEADTCGCASSRAPSSAGAALLALAAAWGRRRGRGPAR